MGFEFFFKFLTHTFSFVCILPGSIVAQEQAAQRRRQLHLHWDRSKSKFRLPLERQVFINCYDLYLTNQTEVCDVNRRWI